MNELSRTFLPQIENLLSDYEAFRVRSDYRTLVFPEELAVNFIARAMDLIERIDGVEGQFLAQTREHLRQTDKRCDIAACRIDTVAGGLLAMRDTIQAGYFVSARAQVLAELFGDFLDMADYLLQDGFKDAAAVIAGGVLEGHLRKLCLKNNIAIDLKSAHGSVRPKSVEAMNVDLATVGVYSKTDQKNITAWYDLRNRAAHGQYGAYQATQVGLLINGIRDFVSRCLA